MQITGVYSAVQHKHSSTQDHAPYRWCSAPTGERLYGREKVREKYFTIVSKIFGTQDDNTESEMTCACSQKRWELEQSKVNVIFTTLK